MVLHVNLGVSSKLAIDFIRKIRYLRNKSYDTGNC